jgi:hypothetical protein
LSRSHTVAPKICSIPKHIASQRSTLARNPLIMKTIIFRYFLFAIVFIPALSFVQSTHAHGGEPRLEISVESLNPGGVVDVRGVEFDYEELITLALIGPQVEISLGDVTADVEGVFTQVVVLPSDLVEGTYYFRGTTSHHWAISPPLTVWGTAITEGGEQGPRDEDDGLLAPMPTFAPAVSTIAVPQAPAVATPAVKWNPTILVLVVLMVIGIVALLGLRMRKI